MTAFNVKVITQNTRWQINWNPFVNMFHSTSPRSDIYQNVDISKLEPISKIWICFLKRIPKTIHCELIQFNLCELNRTVILIVSGLFFYVFFFWLLLFCCCCILNSSAVVNVKVTRKFYAPELIMRKTSFPLFHVWGDLSHLSNATIACGFCDEYQQS